VGSLIAATSGMWPHKRSSHPRPPAQRLRPSTYPRPCPTTRFSCLSVCTSVCLSISLCFRSCCSWWSYLGRETRRPRRCKLDYADPPYPLLPGEHGETDQPDIPQLERGTQYAFKRRACLALGLPSCRRLLGAAFCARRGTGGQKRRQTIFVGWRHFGIEISDAGDCCAEEEACDFVSVAVVFRVLLHEPQDSCLLRSKGPMIVTQGLEVSRPHGSDSSAHDCRGLVGWASG
jgi:hypothetical protein